MDLKTPGHMRKGQTTAVTKSNITVTSFSGNTERKILDNAERIVTESLPIPKVVEYFKETSAAANSIVLGYVSFVNDEKQVSLQHT
ncbi:hypothetical protein QZH41_019903 [Actinostola sp. cb2023]|nr:hypothetical protein QZH41_019903 [Actinostola sp. cb2023]